MNHPEQNVHIFSREDDCDTSHMFSTSNKQLTPEKFSHSSLFFLLQFVMRKVIQMRFLTGYWSSLVFFGSFFLSSVSFWPFASKTFCSVPFSVAGVSFMRWLFIMRAGGEDMILLFVNISALLKDKARERELKLLDERPWGAIGEQVDSEKNQGITTTLLHHCHCGAGRTALAAVRT